MIKNKQFILGALMGALMGASFLVGRYMHADIVILDNTAPKLIRTKMGVDVLESTAERSFASGTSESIDDQLIYMHVASSPNKTCLLIDKEMNLKNQEYCNKIPSDEILTIDWTKETKETHAAHYICVHERTGDQCLDLYDLTER